MIAFGDPCSLRRAPRDGLDAVEWAARQPWSNGTVADHPGLTRRPADIVEFDQLGAALAGHDALMVAFAPADNGYPGYFPLVEAASRIKRSFKLVIPDAQFLKSAAPPASGRRTATRCSRNPTGSTVSSMRPSRRIGSGSSG